MSEILRLLSESRYISDIDVKLLENFITHWKVTPYHALLKTNLLSSFRLADALSEIMQLEHLRDFDQIEVVPGAWEQIPYLQAVEWEAMPLGAKPGTFFRVLLTDPTDEALKTKIRDVIGERVDFAVGEVTVVQQAIDAHYPIELQMPFLSGRNL